MQKRKQLAAVSFVAIFGVIFTTFDLFKASADSITTYSQSLTLFTYVGLAILVISAIWFYILSIKK